MATLEEKIRNTERIELTGEINRLGSDLGIAIHQRPHGCYFDREKLDLYLSRQGSRIALRFLLTFVRDTLIEDMAKEREDAAVERFYKGVLAMGSRVLKMGEQIDSLGKESACPPNL